MPVTVRADPAVKRAIAAISDEAWQTIKDTDAIYDEEAGQWISRAEVAEIPLTAFTSKKTDEQIYGRLVVCRIPDLNPKRNQGQATLSDTWRFHAFFTTVPDAERDTVSADKAHRAHASTCPRAGHGKPRGPRSTPPSPLAPRPATAPT